MKTALFFSAAALALQASSMAFAAAAAPGIGDAGTEVEELVVTATRSEQRADGIGQTVTVLNRATIEASQAAVVSDLLAQTPGVAVSRNGGVGGTTSLRIRGAETDQTLVVIDGVRVNDPSQPGGGYNFANLLAGDIDKIEILRGAQSTLWGSQAIGGVVHILTAKPTRPLQANLDVEGGSFETAYARGGVGGASERLTWRLAGSQYTTSGVSAFAGGAEADAYRNTGASGRLDWRATDHLGLDLRGFYSKARSDFDGFPPPNFSFADTAEYGDTTDLVLYSGVNHDAFGGRLRNRIGYGFTRTDRTNFDPAQALTTVTFDSRGENRRAEYQGVFDIREGWVATFGAESERSKMRSAAPSSFDPNPTPAWASTGIDSVYGQVQAQVIPGLTLTGGVRQDDHQTFGHHTTGQAALAWSLNGGATVIRASYGEGFKAPTLFQLFSDFGNAALTPETAEAWDAGVEHSLLDGRLKLSATYFHRNTTDQIDFFSCPFVNSDPLCTTAAGPRFGYYANIAQTKAQGVELAGTARLAGVLVQGNYTWTDAVNDGASSANFGKRLARRPEHQANVWATYVWPAKVSTTLAVRYVGESFDNPSNSTVLAAYTLVDLRASYPVSQRLEVYGRVENLTDEAYQTTRGYGSPGRAAYAGVRARF
ncbi:MAG: TonB-dependent receptor [Caulobacteraceae bacterium]|nr:TonB-dependent receptor [Caulobacteraceae bacterium]